MTDWRSPAPPTHQAHPIPLTQPTHLLWKDTRSLDLSCVCAMWVFVHVGVPVGSVFVILQLVGPVGKLTKILVMLCSDHQFFFCKCQGRNGFIGSFTFREYIVQSEAVLHGSQHHWNYSVNQVCLLKMQNITSPWIQNYKSPASGRVKGWIRLKQQSRIPSAKSERVLWNGRNSAA